MVNTTTEHFFLQKIPQKFWQQLTKTGFPGSRISKGFLYTLPLQHPAKPHHIFPLFHTGSWTLNCGYFLSHKQTLRKKKYKSHTIQELKKKKKQLGLPGDNSECVRGDFSLYCFTAEGISFDLLEKRYYC